MRLGFHYHIPATSYHNKVVMPAYLGLFIDSLASFCESLVCFQHSPLGIESIQMDYFIKSENVTLVNLGPHTSIPLRTISGFLRRKLFNDQKYALDAMLVRTPTPLLPILASEWKKPLVLMIVADNLTGLENLPQPIWRRKLMHLWALWLDLNQQSVSKHSLNFVNSHLLFNQLQPSTQNLIETRTTTLCKNDFFERYDTCQNPPYHLLFTGRLTRSKGLFEIVTSISQLVTLGFDVVLDMVGMVEKGDSVLDELKNLAISLGVADRITYHGYKTAGPTLLDFYRKADIYVIAPQASSEGFPRTIWEAMASSIPVVATKVGSIPDFIEDAALLVPPKDAAALTIAISTLLTNSEIRRLLISKGMIVARENTLEKRAEEMISSIQFWLDRSSDINY